MDLSHKEKEARKLVCLPLDGLDTLESIKGRVEELKSVVGLFKIGKETFTRFGKAAIDIVHESGREVFLDLKYHDIPNTVKGAAKAATELGVFLFNVHASGGLEMMKAAKAGAEETSKRLNVRRPKIVAVTILTSIDQAIMNNELRVQGSVEDQVLHLAKLTVSAGLDGIVCSAADMSAIKNNLPSDFLYITPGIKAVSDSSANDQKRVFTPGNAIKDGASLLVVGRTITGYDTKEERISAGLGILRDMAANLP